MEVIEYQDDVNAASPPLASPGSAGAHSPPYSQHSQHAVSQSGFPERVPRVVRPTAVRLRPVLDRLPCCGYPGPIKIPLCGDLQCRHLPCYTWHQQHHWWAPASRSCESWEPSPPPASLSVDVQPRLPPQGLLREALLQQPAAAAAVDVTPVQATVTTPGGTVTLYSWPDPVQVADDDVVVVEQVQPPSPPKRARKAPAKPRTPRAPRKPRKAKKDAAKDEDVPGEGVAVDTDTRGALLRVIGLLCDRRGDLDDKDDDKDDDDLSFLQLQPSALRKVRRVLRGVAKALM